MSEEPQKTAPVVVAAESARPARRRFGLLTGLLSRRAAPPQATPSETAPSEDAPSEDAPSKDTPSKDAPSKDTPAEPEAKGTPASKGTNVSKDTPGGEISDRSDSPGKKGIPQQRKASPDERPPGAPPDPWSAFTAIPEKPPGLIRRGLRFARRRAVHEYALVTYAAVLLAVAMTWPTLRYPAYTLPQDLGDPSRQAWLLSWAGHILATDPVRLWHSNAYFPLSHSFASGDSLLGYALFAMIGSGPTAAVVRYNLLFVAAHALLVIGAYALVRQLGARPIGASVAAVAFAYAPWRLAQEGHLDIVSAGGIPLALAMLARGHGWSLRYGYRPARRSNNWTVAGWAVATWQLGMGFSLGVPFGYVLGLFVLVLPLTGVFYLIQRLRRRKPKPWIGFHLLTTDFLGASIFAGVGLVLAVPYVLVPDSDTKTQEIGFFSPPLRSLLIGPAESRVWGAAHETPRASLGWAAEMSLLPGFVLYALAIAGLFLSIWRFRHRLLLLVALAGATVLTLGTTFFGGRWTYLPLFGHYPASFDLRIPGRLMLWVTLLLAILAAGAVDEFVRRARHLAAQRFPPWPGPWLRLAMVTPLLLVTLEGWNATAHPVVPEQPQAMRTVTGQLLVLPTGDLTDQTVQLWSTTRFQSLANGGGAFAAARQSELRSRVASFPDAASVEYLRSVHVTVVVLLRAESVGTSWERSGIVPVDALGISREDLDENTVVFRLG
ncbi:hypothetical protein [Actinoplanes sp. NBRC 101535]|uniref:hypothetical protein n=1 Tax=Actinoplanes sp. NBRC 101535 TaxID=3032196 RepID=UPI0024A448C9|nr:hypothetical protein [Actinoplanes sp. NBRC 101535]GLY08542.1 hypothetical protein Acsp01_89210 [Actinoplanes sp. NBRC 101535]